MASIIQRSTKAAGSIVCTGQSCSVSEDGLITINARFLLPSTEYLKNFQYDVGWPSGSSPRNLPSNQGGPYLSAYSPEYTNGLIFVNATYVTATNPVRVVYTKQRATRAFTGTPISTTGLVDTQSISFDYISTVTTARFAIIDDQRYTPDLSSAKIDYVIGVPSTWDDNIATRNIDTKDTEQIGRVSRVSLSREVIFRSI